MQQQNIGSVTVSHRLTKGERIRLKKQQDLHDLESTYEGIDFSRIGFPELLERRDRGEVIEFEALGPYMTDYRAHSYVLSPNILTPVDAIGFELAKSFRQLFPRARLVSLYDDYNTTHATEDDGTVSAVYAAKDKQVFLQSLDKMFHAAGMDTYQPPLLLSESSKVSEAEELVATLDDLHMIERRGHEIIFIPPAPENPLYDRITLRTKRGKWLCVALDAAGFLHEDNRHITHLIALPTYLKEQQDKMWEILRVLAIPSDQYHNIFYDPMIAPEAACRVVACEFEKAARNL